MAKSRCHFAVSTRLPLILEIPEARKFFAREFCDCRGRAGEKFVYSQQLLVRLFFSSF